MTERIRSHFFRRDGCVEEAARQEQILEGIRSRIVELLAHSLGKDCYRFLGEQRTYAPRDFLEALERLIVANVNVGEADRRKLSAIAAGVRDVDLYIREELVSRTANEARAQSKNDLDELFRALVEGEHRGGR